MPGAAFCGLRHSESDVYFVGEWLEFVVEVAKTSLDSTEKQGTLASPTTKVRAIGLTPARSP